MLYRLPQDKSYHKIEGAHLSNGSLGRNEMTKCFTPPKTTHSTVKPQFTASKTFHFAQFVWKCPVPIVLFITRDPL